MELLKYIDESIKSRWKSGFQVFEIGYVLIEDFIVEAVFHIAAFFHGNDEVSVGEQLKMVGNRGLGQGGFVVEVDAVQAVLTFLFDLLQDHEPVRIRQGL